MFSSARTGEPGPVPDPHLQLKLNVQTKIKPEMEESSESDESDPGPAPVTPAADNTEDNQTHSSNLDSNKPASNKSNIFFSSLLSPGPSLPAPPTSPESYQQYVLKSLYLQQYMSNNLSKGGFLPDKARGEVPASTNGTKKSEKKKEGGGEGPLDLSTRQPGDLPSLLRPPTFPFSSLQQMLISSQKSQETPGPAAGPVESPSQPASESLEAGAGTEPSYVCPICGQMFSLHDRLAKHMASRHKSKAGAEGSKAYFCDVCRRSFARSDMLTRHMRLHTGIKPYTCRVCGQVFSRWAAISHHLPRNHS